ncbi:MAG TPA: hypothetical protein VFM35_02555, partial [Candidatus Binatia bacterium]|nr:hypothetical protein [Candidatus Binatia bacterium]
APGAPMARSMGLKAGTKQATVDGDLLTLPTAPEWLQQDFDMAVPLRSLAKAFGIPNSWDSRSRILSLRHPKLARNAAVELFEERLLHTAPTRDTDSFVPARFSLRQVDMNGVLRYRVEIRLKAVPGAAKGKPTMYTVAVYENGNSAIGGWRIFTSTDAGSTKDPCTKQNAVTSCIDHFDVAGSPLRYILMRIRVFP